MTNLVSHYLYGDQLSLEVTPDETRAFSVEGAMLSVLDLTVLTTGGTPTLIEQVPLPECQGLAQAFFQHPFDQQRYLFIAGGGLGLWRLSLCQGLFNSSPTACGAAAYSPVRIYEALGGYFERKRCVDVAVVEGSAGGAGDPILYALFAARNSTLESGIGATELRAYKLTGTGYSLLTSHVFPSFTPPPTYTSKIGTSLAVDPGNPNSIYVGMGKGGIWRADLSGPLTPTLTANQLSIDFAPLAVENVTDIAIIRTQTPCGTKAFLYGALYNRIIEYDLAASTYTLRSIDCGFAEQIAVAKTGSSSVLVAVAQQENPRIEADSTGPAWVNGLWNTLCLGQWLEDPDNPTPLPDCNEIRFYQRDLCSASTLEPLSASTSIPYPRYWGTLALRSQPSPSVCRLYACSTTGASAAHDVNVSSASTSLAWSYVGKAFAGQEGTQALLNPGVMRFGQEYPGKVTTEGGMLYIDPSPPYDITPITQTVFCNPPVSTGCTPEDTCNDNANGAPYAGNILGECNWVDPTSPDWEWFFCGNPTLERVTRNSCALCPCVCTHASPCLGDPCVPSSPTFYRRGPITSATDFNRVAWQLVGLNLAGSGLPSVPSMDMHWWQLEIPLFPGGPGSPQERKSDGVPYISSIADPRFSSTGEPAVVYALRGGSTHGVKVIQTKYLVGASTSTCAASGQEGNGEPLTLQDSDIVHVFTHVELEKSGLGSDQCVIQVECGPGDPLSPLPRHLNNTRAEIYSTRDPGGNTAWILALAAGFPGVFGPQLNPCFWETYAGRPMLVLYDVTETAPSFTTPELLRVGIGNDQGNAFTLRTKTYGSGVTARTYAFVGDVLGKLIVFNVSGINIFPAASEPYLPGTTVRSPVTTIDFPKDPYDGRPANVIDMELEGNYLYCALGRVGVGIVDVTLAGSPVLCAVLDTPGLAMGITLRTVMDATGSHRQMIVGDSRCGVRVYE